jgi:hypothetical protein
MPLGNHGNLVTELLNQGHHMTGEDDRSTGCDEPYQQCLDGGCRDRVHRL